MRTSASLPSSNIRLCVHSQFMARELTSHMSVTDQLGAVQAVTPPPYPWAGHRLSNSSGSGLAIQGINDASMLPR